MNTRPIVVIPWDFSPHAQNALDFAIEYYGSDCIRVICVLEPALPYEMGWGDEEGRQKAIDFCIRDFFDSAGHAHETGLTFFAEFGEPSDEIIQFAKNQNADFVIMSTHGRTGLKKLFMGSVTQKVIGKAACPVIVLPATWAETEAN